MSLIRKAISALAWAASVVALAVVPALAQPLAKPADRPFLEVTGKIKVTNDGDKAAFDLALHAIGCGNGRVPKPPKFTVLNCLGQFGGMALR